MRKIIIFTFLPLYFIAPTSFAADFMTDEDCSVSHGLSMCAAGCLWNSTAEPNICQPCPINTYNDVTGQTECKQCPDTYPNTETIGATRSSLCFSECVGEEPIDNGKKILDNQPKNYPEPCGFTLVCNNESDPCNGYHPSEDNSQCIPNTQTCNGENGTGVKYWNSETKSYSECFLTQCNSGYHLQKTGTSPCGTEYGECISNTQSCHTLLGNCNGTIFGDAIWNDLTGYDFSACTCSTRDAQIENGTGKTNCAWESGNGGSTVWSTSNCEVEVATCNKGYCETDAKPGECSPAPIGYYNNNNNNEQCLPCPAGATTQNTGSATAESCVMLPGATQFCDKNGCFTLPGTEIIRYDD